ncbi:MAG: DNA adenine methylase [Deltaproteobacteria bacterium]|nr:DNA adenine methylase [Deltaproteobacteria bacterium]
MGKVNPQQLALIENIPVFPSTRYQGSKLKIVDWIWKNIKDLQFHTALDAFGGTGCVAYMLKQKGKQVTYNDILKFNWFISLALIENDSITLTPEDVNFLLTKHKKIKYPTFVYDTFKDIYFTDEENQWIDVVVTNIGQLKHPYKRALAYYALFQSCIIKRPFNLFHRKNLYLRLSKVERNFGNKTTWDTSFEMHFRKFVGQVNQAVFSNGMQNKAFNLDVFDVEGDFDLVYIDTPYISKKGVGVDYFGFYHFLEGLVRYSDWEEMIDYQTKHKKLRGYKNPWIDKNQIYSAFERLIKKFADSILVISYRSDGIPAISELVNLLKEYKPNVEEIKQKSYKYVLSNNHSEEVLLIGK